MTSVRIEISFFLFFSRINVSTLKDYLPCKYELELEEETTSGIMCEFIANLQQK